MNKTNKIIQTKMIKEIKIGKQSWNYMIKSYIYIYIYIYIYVCMYMYICMYVYVKC